MQLLTEFGMHLVAFLDVILGTGI